MSDLKPTVPKDQKTAETVNGITVGAFVGALAGETARARSISDQASVQIANQYLHNELLRGFPIPRMQIRDLEVDLNFAVASQPPGASFLEDQEVQRNISYRIQDFLGSLPAARAFKLYFRSDAKLAARWTAGLEELAKRFLAILSKPGADSTGVTFSLSLSVQNYFFESASGALRSNLFSLLSRPLDKAGESDSMKAIVEKEIQTIVSSSDRSGSEASPGSTQQVGMMVGAAQLEKLNPANLSKMKIALSPSDRRWVATDQDGKKVYILGT